MSKQLHRFITFAFANADMLFEVESNGRISFTMGASASLLNRSESELNGSHWLDMFHLEDRSVVVAATQSLAIGARCGPLTIRITPSGTGGKMRTLLFTACRLPATEDRLSCTLSRSVAARALQAEEPKRDAETQLLEKDSFADKAASILKAAEEGGEELAVSFVDVPQLAALAETDPDKASGLVRKIGDLLRGSSVDGASAGRLSDARFGVVHRGDSAELNRKLADMTRESAEDGVELAFETSDLKVVAGELRGDELVKAVRFSVNRFAQLKPGETMPDSASEAFEQMVQATVKRMAEFTAIVDEDRFVLMYQPIVDILRGDLHHFELLVRFEEGKSPFEMIQFAEEIGIIERFDLAVCGRAFSMLRAHADQRSKPLHLAINISGRSIENSIFVQMLLKMLSENRDQARYMALEITESAQLTDLAAVDQIIQDIRALGYIVCLDDFGSGAASFQYMQALKVDFVKIDGAYVKRIGQSERDDIMLRGIVRLCSDLKIGTIAEMVETIEQATLLQGMGVGYGQGWLYGKPLPQPVWKMFPVPDTGAAPAPLPPPPGRPSPPANFRRRRQTMWD